MGGAHRLGKPVVVGILLAAAMALGACDDPKPAAGGGSGADADAAAPIVPGPPIQAREASPTHEPAKEDVRIIGGGKLTGPTEAPEGELIRLPAEHAAEEANRREAARLPKAPTSFARPLAIDAATLRSGGTVIELAGVRAHPATHRCEIGGASWPCGNFARAALQRLIRARSIACDGEFTGEARFRGQCRLGGTDLAAWLVAQGWAAAATDDLKPLEAEARKAGRGIWRSTPPPQ
ncbi:MAG: thermonuclease family protein [Nitratireductor sp.]|nr:thermonuclease family protein [Nitratireductor sp.]